MSGPGTQDRPIVRRAVPSDAEELTGLRAIMLDDLAEGAPAAGDADWRAATVAWFADRLAGDDLAVFVAEDPELGLVASAAGSISRGAPTPGAPAPWRGQLFAVVTDPRARRQGHARRCAEAVVAWLDARGASRVDLVATPGGLDLYRELGFVERPWVPMRRVQASAGRR